MKYDKLPKSISECILLLEKRGLKIQDPERCEKYLRTIGYFRLTGYMFHLQSKDGTHYFRQNITFEDIINLYQFDKKLRAILLEYLERIEICLRAKLTNKYSLKFGFFWYNNSKLFADLTTFNSIIAEILDSFKDPKEQFLKAFKFKYTEENLPPSNMALEILSLGKLARMYSGLANDETKQEIATEFNLPSTILSSWFIYLANVRNICAHHSRLWNKKVSADRPIFPTREKYKFNGINAEDSNTTVYGIISIIDRLLVTFNNPNKFTSKVEQLIDEYKINTRLMGFPSDWQKSANWRN